MSDTDENWISVLDMCGINEISESYEKSKDNLDEMSD